MDHAVDVRGDVSPAGRHSAHKYPQSEDEESEFDEEDWEEEEEEEEEEESEDVDSEWDIEDVDVEEESDEQCSCSISLGKEGGNTDEMAEDHKEAIREDNNDDSDRGNRARKDEAETGLSVSANSVAAASTSDSSSIFTAASPRADVRVSAPTKGSVFGSLASTAAMSPSPQAPSMPLVSSAFPFSGTPPVLPSQPLFVTTKSSIASCTAVQDQQQQQQQNTTPAPPPTIAPTPATQQKQALTTVPLHFVDFERSLGQKTSSSDGPRARSAAEEAQDVKRARQRYKLVLPTDKFDKQIEKALYGN